MKTLIALLPLFALTTAFADESPTSSSVPHRFIIERTFPKGALDHLDSKVKNEVNQNNASLGVRWLHSYANADETKTFCVYEGPSEAAVRKAAELNKLPVDSVTEIPVELESGVAKGASAKVEHK
jgi:hypothetical protein